MLHEHCATAGTVEVPEKTVCIMRVGYKVWLDQEGKVFGEGPCQLLMLVAEKKSLRQAALEMGMSYSKAWGLISRIEEKLGFGLLERRAGGKAGGGSELTPEAQLLMERYLDFSADVKEAMGRIYAEHFSSFEKDVSKRLKRIGRAK